LHNQLTMYYFYRICFVCARSGVCAIANKQKNAGSQCNEGTCILFIGAGLLLSCRERFSQIARVEEGFLLFLLQWYRQELKIDR